MVNAPVFRLKTSRSLGVRGSACGRAHPGNSGLGEVVSVDDFMWLAGIPGASYRKHGARTFSTSLALSACSLATASITFAVARRKLTATPKSYASMLNLLIHRG